MQNLLNIQQTVIVIKPLSNKPLAHDLNAIYFFANHTKSALIPLMQLL